MQSQIYQILALRSGKSLRQIIRDTKRNDFYLDAQKAKDYGLIDKVLSSIERAAAEMDAEPRAQLHAVELVRIVSRAGGGAGRGGPSTERPLTVELIPDASPWHAGCESVSSDAQG